MITRSNSLATHVGQVSNLRAAFQAALFGFSTLLLLTSTLASAEQVDWIYSARYVLPMDGRADPIENGAVAIRGERIVSVGPRAQIDKQYQSSHRVDRPEALILPGLINTHTHAAMSLLRGIADDLRLQDWLQNYIFPAEKKNVKADFVLWGTRLACLEMKIGRAHV